MIYIHTHKSQYIIFIYEKNENEIYNIQNLKKHKNEKRNYKKDNVLTHLEYFHKTCSVLVPLGILPCL